MGYKLTLVVAALSCLAVIGLITALLRAITGKYRDYRPSWQLIMAAFLGFTAWSSLDWVILAALPALHLSYGPATIGWFTLFLIRGIIFLLWVLLSHINAVRKKNRFAIPGFFLNQVAFALITGFVIYAFYWEPFAISQTQMSIPGPSRAARSIRIVHLSDLHIEYITKREQEMIRQVNALKPDLVVITGDFINSSFQDNVTSREHTRKLLSQIIAPFGIYVISGNMDSPQDLKELVANGREVITNNRLHQVDLAVVLDNTYRQVDIAGTNISLLGISITDPKKDAATLKTLLKQIPPNSYPIFLYHSPDLADEVADTPIPLYLAGHTHGGQIRVPFYGALVTFSAFGKRYEMGKYTVGQTTLYVNRGMGMEGWYFPRLRVLCPPEIGVFDLLPVQ